MKASGCRRAVAVLVSAVTLVSAAGLTAAPAAATTGATTGPYATSVLADSPLSYYRFDEVSGSSAADSSGHGNDGTYVAQTQLGQTGALLSAANGAIAAHAAGVVFHQSGDTLPTDNAPRTVEGWFNYVCCNGPIDLFAYGDVAGGHGFEVELGDSAVSISVVANGSTVSANTLGDASHGWHLVDVTYDGTTALVYQDGQVIGGGTLGSTTTAVPGQGLFADANQTAMGLDELAVYGTALTPARVGAHWSTGANSIGAGECATTPSGLYPTTVLGDQPLAYYRLDEMGTSALDRVAFDASPHCANAAYVNHPTSTSGALPGGANTAEAANTRGTMLSASGAALPSGNSARTFEAWIDYNCCNGPIDLFRYGDVAGGNGFEVVLGDSAATISAIGGGNTVSVPTVGDFAHGWHLVDVTYAADGTVEVFEDGQIIGGGTLDVGVTGTVVPGQGMQMAGNAQNFGLDEVAVYGAALTPAKVDAHWSAGESDHGAGPCAAATNAPYPASVLADSPTLYYRLDDAAVGAKDRLALDLSGACSNAAYVGSPTADDGSLLGDTDAATAAGGAGTVLTQSGAGLPAAGTARTVEMWVHYACCNGPIDLFRYGDVAGGHGFEVVLGDSAASLAVTGPGSTLVANTAGLDLAHGWHLVDVSYSAGTANIFVDGQVVNSGSIGTLATVVPGQGFRVGANANGMETDELAVFPAALTPARVNAHWEAQYLTPPGTSLIAGSATLSNGGGGAVGARIQACPTSGAACVVDPTPAGPSGQFHLIVPDGSYTVTVFPPSGSTSGPKVLGPYTLPPGINDLQATFLAPGSLPTGATFSSPSQGTTSEGGVPNLNWGEPSTFTVTACQNGAGLLYIRAFNTSTGLSETRAVNLVETPVGSGTYVAQIPPLAPDHGLAGLDPQVACPGHTNVVPDGGTPNGGNAVLIGGSGFTGAKSVKFGATAASSFSVVTDDLIKAVVPAGTGVAPVTVTDSSNAVVAIGDYNYFDVTSISPGTGPASGGTTVTINGHGFDNVHGVLFGVMPAPSFSVVNDTEIQASAPIGMGTVNVQVVNGYAASLPAAGLQFTYTGGPPGSTTIVETTTGGDADLTGYANQVNAYCSTHDCAAAGMGGVAANAGEATTPVTSTGAAEKPPEGVPPQDWIGLVLSGAGVICLAPGADVACAVVAVAGLAVAAYTVLRDLKICPHLGDFDPFGCNVKVDPSGTVVDGVGNPINGATATILTQPGGQGAFVAVDPTSGAITPATNPETTGATGGFDWDAIAGAYKVQATAPGCHAPGNAGQPAVTTPAFLIPPPAIGLVLTMTCPAASPPTPGVTALQPGSGSTGGGNTVDITGTGLANVTEVDFGSVVVTQVQVLSPFAVRVVAPAGTGTVDVTVKSAGGTSATTDGDSYDYVAPVVTAGGPVVTGVSPDSGPLTGGTAVTITGSGLSNATAVSFGGAAATSLTNVSATEVDAVAPSSAFPAQVDVTVTTPVGTSAVVAADHFLYGGPGSLTPPTVSGHPLLGDLLTVTPGTWSRNPATLLHRWQRCNAAGGACVAISGATSSTYRLAAADVGHRVRVAESAVNEVGTSGPVPSAPTAKVWTVKMLGPAAAVSLHPKLTISYAATAGGTPSSYDVRYRAAAWNTRFGHFVNPASWQATSATKKLLTGSAGHEYCVSARVRDGAGGLSAWSTERCTTLPLDDRALTPGPGWTRTTGRAFYLHTATRSSKKGATLTRAKAAFDRLTLVVATCPTCGKVAVVVNGKVIATVNTASAKAHTQRLVVLRKGKLRTATVVLRVVTSGKPVTVDGLAFTRT